VGCNKAASVLEKKKGGQCQQEGQNVCFKKPGVGGKIYIPCPKPDKDSPSSEEKRLSPKGGCCKKGNQWMGGNQNPKEGGVKAGTQEKRGG